MEESRKKSKTIGSLLGIFGFIALVAGATYAWLTWRSNNIIIAGSTECFDVVYYRKDLGTVENPAMLKFMTNYNRDNLNQVVENPQYAEVGLSLDPRCTNVSGLGKLYLTTNVSTDDILLTGGLYYTLVKVENSTETFIKDGPITTEGDILLQDNIFVSSTTGDTKYRVYIWINGPITTDQNYVGASYVGEIRAEVVSREDNTPPVTAADYITNLYTEANKSPATVNGITYSLASDVGLMRDQFGSSSSASNTGNLRYYGADPNNYVWLGDTYTSDITFPGNEREGIPDIVRQAGDKKLWRIVGIFDGRLKLVTADPISTTNLSWDTSANTTGGNSGFGINQWGPSGTYEGADLMKLLNPGFESGSVNNSLYWNKGTGTVYTGGNNTTTSNVSFSNTGLTSNERSLIDIATWYTGAYDQFSYADAHYTAERGTMSGKAACTQGTTNCDDTVTRTNTWNGKVGLISASDYGYAANLAQCNQTLDNYYETGCTDTDWLDIRRVYLTLSPRAHSGYAYRVFRVNIDGDLGFDSAYFGLVVRPAVLLKSGVIIDTNGKDGSFEHPYVLS